MISAKISATLNTAAPNLGPALKEKLGLEWGAQVFEQAGKVVLIESTNAEFAFEQEVEEEWNRLVRAAREVIEQHCTDDLDEISLTVRVGMGGRLRVGSVDVRGKKSPSPERDNRTLEEVGADFEATRERIRQIEAKALRKLRHPSRSARLRKFIKDNE